MFESFRGEMFMTSVVAIVQAEMFIYLAHADLAGSNEKKNAACLFLSYWKHIEHRSFSFARFYNHQHIISQHQIFFKISASIASHAPES